MPLPIKYASEVVKQNTAINSKTSLEFMVTFASLSMGPFLVWLSSFEDLSVRLLFNTGFQLLGHEFK